jgi:hypothetical protein
MIKVEVIEKFTLEDYKKLKNVKKVTNRKENEFDVKDTFECTKEMAEYLTGNNALNKVVVKVVEVTPENKISVRELPPKIENVDEAIERIEESVKEEVKLNELGNPVGTRKVKKKRTSKK